MASARAASTADSRGIKQNGRSCKSADVRPVHKSLFFFFQAEDGIRARAVNQAFGPEIADRLQPHADLDSHVTLRCPDGLELPLPLSGRLECSEAHLLELL